MTEVPKSKSMNWFQYDRVIRHEIVNSDFDFYLVSFLWFGLV